MNVKSTIPTTHRHVHWTNSHGKPCRCRIVMTLSGDRVFVEFATLPPKSVMCRRMVLPLSALVEELES